MKPSEATIQIATELIEKMFAHNFGKVLDRNYEGHDNSWEWARENEEFFPVDAYFASGCTKLVLIHPALEHWVLKFPTDISPATMKKFVIDGEEPAADYCAQEVRNYERAVEAGLSCYFAATYKLMDYEGHAIYIQEKASCDADQCSDMFWTSVSKNIDREDFDSDDDYTEYVNDCVEEMTDEDSLVAMFGNIIYEGLEAFISDYYINDLHAGNFGFIDNRPVMVDYSGY